MTQRNWIGQSSPRSSTGKSALVEPLPHHISTDAIHVVFSADPQIVARFLPPGLEPLEDGRGWGMVADMMKVSVAEPEQYWRDPQRSCYTEGLVGFYCRYKGKIYRYSAFVWVDRDWSMGMGQIFGWSKRLATIHRTRINETNPGLPARKTHGLKLAGTVERHGRLVMRVDLSIDKDSVQLERLPDFEATTLLYRYIASPGPKIAEVEQLLELGFTNVNTTNIWSGQGQVHFGESENEELSQLGAVKVIEAYTYKRGWTTDTQAVLLKDYTASNI
ncbi:MAG: hypothetical protein EBQ84_00895 [Betaproteobacteria bacterium]|nr:hypothetical protein [Betaproteobacteria bacterium]